MDMNFIFVWRWIGRPARAKLRQKYKRGKLRQKFNISAPNVFSRARNKKIKIIQTTGEQSCHRNRTSCMEWRPCRRTSFYQSFRPQENNLAMIVLLWSESLVERCPPPRPQRSNILPCTFTKHSLLYGKYEVFYFSEEGKLYSAP